MAETASGTGLAEPEAVSAHRAFLRWTGHKMLLAKDDIHGMGAFLLITLSVGLSKLNKARTVIRPLIRRQIERAGIDLLPMIGFLALALGLVVIGQTVFLLHRYGAESYAGTVMASVVVRELGPAIAALLVLARVGTANVVELGTARALGEVEALEALGIDPIHYLVVPRVIGLALSIFSLTVYLIMLALLGGYLFAFLQDVPLRPGEYFRQLAAALLWQDFVLVALKTLCFGTLIAIVTCYEGLASPLRLEEVSRATTSAVGKCVIGVVLLDALFIFVYLVL
ncbi:MAG TPA: ABC transporter permease [Verrucomicrobiae bacterium]|nr:ABC transporter permease [Verrucomicrobiae bacterium]